MISVANDLCAEQQQLQLMMDAVVVVVQKKRRQSNQSELDRDGSRSTMVKTSKKTSLMTRVVR